MTIFFCRIEINLTEQKGEKKIFFFVREIWKNVTLKYDAISDGVSYGKEEEGMERKIHKNIFHIWEHVKVIKVTQKETGISHIEVLLELEISYTFGVYMMETEKKNF